MSDDPLMRLDDDPDTDAVHQPYTALNQGFDAATQGIPSSLNPYAGTELERWWEEGYEEYLRQATE